MSADEVRSELLRAIVHAEFRAHATYREVRRLCLEARHYRLGAVLVHPVHCARAAAALAGSDVRLIAAVAYPTGAFTSSGKAFEARDAISHGADEVSYVADIGALRSEKDGQIVAEMDALREVTRGHRLTAVLETSVLTDEQSEKACVLAADSGIEYVAPFTGIGPAEAGSVETVRRMARAAAGRIGVVAVGKIEGPDEACSLLAAGARRLWTEGGVCLAERLRGKAP